MTRFMMLGISALAVVSCRAPSLPIERYQDLREVRATTDLGGPVLPGVLRVEVLRADPIRTGRSLVLGSEGKAAVEREAAIFWVEDPPRLVAERLAECLRTAGLADEVALWRDPIAADWRLGGSLKRFDLDPVAGEALVVLDLAVSDARSRRPLVRQRYSSTKRVPGKASDEAVAAAFAAALDTICEDVGRRVVAACNAGRATCRRRQDQGSAGR